MTEPTTDEAVLRQWIGNEQHADDTIMAGPATRMAATLDAPRAYGEGDALPALWHWFYFLQAAPMAEVDRDGHTAKGGFLPPVALPRRMWAGSHFTFHEPVRVGMQVAKTSRVKDVTVKEGRSGTLCFVTVEHRFESEGTLLLVEDHNVVFREDPAPDQPVRQAEPAPASTEWHREIVPGPVFLFRYSALTFNGHRIHYDRPYCTDVEGYPGLIVHGPLTGTLLAGLAEEKLGRLKTWQFTARSPLFDTAPFSIDGERTEDGGRFWATDPSGGLAMEGTASA